jgi:hypothetical protein
MGIGNSELIMVREFASSRLLVATVLHRDDSWERLRHTRQANLSAWRVVSEPGTFGLESVPQIVALGRSDPRTFQVPVL